MASPAFANGSPIPARYTCGGADVSPQLAWSGVPGDAQSVAVTAIDPDAPGTPFVHWLVFNLPPTSAGLPEGVLPGDSGLEGRNDFGSSGYRGPCPPPGRVHHYHFKVYALRAKLSLRAGATESAFQAAIKGQVIATGELVGTFKR